MNIGRQVLVAIYADAGAVALHLSCWKRRKLRTQPEVFSNLNKNKLKYTNVYLRPQQLSYPCFEKVATITVIFQMLISAPYTWAGRYESRGGQFEYLSEVCKDVIHGVELIDNMR